MKNLAPSITRQRLLIEGFYKIDANKSLIIDYFKIITKSLNLRMYRGPIIFSPCGEGKDINQGYDAFVPLIDSGISVYVWSNTKFLSLIIYTCKSFDKNKAIEVTKRFWKIDKIESQSF
ncbi:S-adenosylmethionine decarboxylase [Candidatus Woesearchaeota archaeon]|nr:S-adenosylmethionine decarboxylase [Candidatus Woesearchaeota archaeon]